MKNRPRLEARRGMNARPGFDKGPGMKARAGLDDRLGQMIAAEVATRFVGRAHGVPQHAHELEVQRGGDQSDRGGGSHASESANPARGR